MTKVSLIFAISIGSFTLSNPAYADTSSNLAAKVRKCALIQDNTERFTCYDLLGESLLKSPEPISRVDDINPNPSNTPVTTNTKTDDAPEEPIQKLSDTIGGGKFDTSEKKVVTSRGKVTSCKKTSDSRWFFFFENGQVWKQTDRRQRFFKDCDFYVNMTEDGFGYKMLIEGKKSKIRVRRVR
jgi:hypothetical protein